MIGRYLRKSGMHYFHEFSNVARHAAVIETPYTTYACQEPLSEGELSFTLVLRAYVHGRHKPRLLLLLTRYRRRPLQLIGLCMH